MSHKRPIPLSHYRGIRSRGVSMTDGGPMGQQSSADLGGNWSPRAAVAARIGFFSRLGCFRNQEHSWLVEVTNWRATQRAGSSELG
jgi:hypothetical protein